MIVIAGDSHCNALGRALDDSENADVAGLKTRFGAIAVRTILSGNRFQQPFFRLQDDAITFEFGAHKFFAEMTGTDGCIRRGDPNYYVFSMGFHPTILVRQEFWKDFTILSGVSGKNFVSAAAFAALVREENKHVINFAKSLKALQISCVFVIAPSIRQAMIDRQKKYAEAAELISVHRNFVGVMRSEFDAIGMPYLSPPETTEESGILKQAYDIKSATDVHHANTAFGSLTLREIARNAFTP